MMLRQEDKPSSHRRNSIMRGKTYIDKVLAVAIDNVNKDKTR